MVIRVGLCSDIDLESKFKHMTTKKRLEYEEDQLSDFDQLIRTIIKQKIDAIFITGNLFGTAKPKNRTIEMPKVKVSVISPFRVQAKILNNFISSKVVDLLNGTVHVMQGQTRDIVIGSIAATNSSIFLAPPKYWILDLAENIEEIFKRLNYDAKKCQKIYKFNFRPVLDEIKQKWNKSLKEYSLRNFNYNERELKMSTYAGYEYKGNITN